MIYWKGKCTSSFLLKLNVKAPHRIFMPNIKLAELSSEFKSSRRKRRLQWNEWWRKQCQQKYTDWIGGWNLIKIRHKYNISWVKLSIATSNKNNRCWDVGENNTNINRRGRDGRTNSDYEIIWAKLEERNMPNTMSNV